MVILTKVVNNNKPEQRTKSMHNFFLFVKGLSFPLLLTYMYKFKVKDWQKSQGVSRGKLCHLT